MNYILNKVETKNVISTLTENDSKYNLILESDNSVLLEDYMFNEFGFLIENGYLMEVDESKAKKSLLSKISDIIKNIYNKVKNTFGKIVKGIWSLVKKLFPFMLAVGVGFLIKYGAGFIKVSNKNLGFLAKMDRFIKGKINETNNPDKAINDVGSSFDKISRYLLGFIKFIAEAIKKGISELFGIKSSESKYSPDIDPGKVDELDEKYGDNMIFPLTKKIGNAASSIMDFAHNIYTGFYNLMEWFLNKLSGNMTASKPEQKSRQPEPVDKITDKDKAIVNKIKNEALDNIVKSQPNKKFATKSDVEKAKKISKEKVIKMKRKAKREYDEKMKAMNSKPSGSRLSNERLKQYNDLMKQNELTFIEPETKKKISIPVYLYKSSKKNIQRGLKMVGDAGYKTLKTTNNEINIIKDYYKSAAINTVNKVSKSKEEAANKKDDLLKAVKDAFYVDVPVNY